MRTLFFTGKTGKSIVRIIVGLSFALSLAFCLPPLSSAQADSSSITRRNLRIKNPEGTEFWLCFQKNYKATTSASDSLLLELFITGDEDANVRIEIDGIAYRNKLFIPGRTVKSIRIPADAELKSDEIVERLSVHVTSDKPINVYGLNRRKQTTDTYLGFSTEVLGLEYRAICYTVSDGLMPQIGIVGTEDNTEVTITPTANTNKHKAGQPYTVRLRKGDVYQIVALDALNPRVDLTGTLIKSNKKIAVFSGHQCAYVPPKEIACNHLVEQLPPINSWGKHFYIGKLQPRSSYTYRVVANEPQTRVFEDNRLVRVLNEGEFYEAMVKRNIQVTASKPVLVAQYSHGFKSGDMIGDPMMLLISPTQQFLKQYRFATPVNGSWQHYVNVVVPTAAIGTMAVDGRRLDSSQFEPLGISRYSIAYIKVPFGTHILEGGMPFGMYSYGFGYDRDSFDAYGTMGGQSFLEYEPAKDSLSPMAEVKSDSGRAELIFRDDRVDDSGIRNVRIISSLGIIPEIPSKYDEGLPQLQVNLKPENPTSMGKLVIETQDVAMNKSVFTVCYLFDGGVGKFVYLLNEGTGFSCQPDPGFQAGVFGKLSAALHFADFSNTGTITSNGRFNEASGFGGIGGFYFGRSLLPKLMISARLSFESLNGTLEAPESRPYFNPQTLSVDTMQINRTIHLNGIFMNTAFAAEYYIEPYLYTLCGLNFAVPLSKSVTYGSKIVNPVNAQYEGMNSTVLEEDQTLSSISSFGVGLFGGFGISLPINYRVTAFAESVFTYRLNNIISDGAWKIHQISFIAGARLRI